MTPPQDALPYAGAAQSMREGLPVYGTPPHFYDLRGDLDPIYVTSFVAPPPALTVTYAVDAVASPIVAFPLLFTLVGLRAAHLSRDPLLALVSVPALLSCMLKGQTATVLWWAAAALLWAGPLETAVALALAVSFKLWPIAVVIYLCARCDRRGWVALAIVTVLAVAAFPWWGEWLGYLTGPELAKVQHHPENWKAW